MSSISFQSELNPKRAAQFLVVRTAQTLTVDVDRLSLDQVVHGTHRFPKCQPKLLGIAHRENPSKGILRRNPVGQIQKGSQSGFFAFAKILNICPAIRSTNDRTDGYGDHLNQFVLFGAILARIRYFAKMLFNGFLGMVTSSKIAFFLPIPSQFGYDCPDCLTLMGDFLYNEIVKSGNDPGTLIWSLAQTSCRATREPIAKPAGLSEAILYTSSLLD